MKGVYRHGKRYKVNATVAGRRVVCTGFASEEAAQAWLDDRRAGVAEPEAGGPTVAEVVRFYLEHVRCKSIDRQRQHAAHVLRLLGERPAQSLREPDRDDYRAARVQEGAADKTAWNEMGMLRAACRYAWKGDVLKEQPRWGLWDIESVRDVTATDEQLGLLLAAADLPLRRVIVAAVAWGRRRDEIIRAEWSWLHGDLVCIPGTNRKNRKPLRMPLSPDLRAMLELEPRHSRWMFPEWRRGRNGKGKLEAVPWARTTLRRRWEALCEVCGCSGLHLHDLRRTGASSGLAMGFAPAAMAAWGGWADQQALLRHYSHASTEQARAVGEALERRLGLVQGGKR